jgi:hypothetical protein
MKEPRAEPEAGTGQSVMRSNFERAGLALGGNVMADVFNTVGQEFTLFELESHTVFEKDSTDAAEISKQGVKVG